MSSTHMGLSRPNGKGRQDRMSCRPRTVQDYWTTSPE